MMIKSVVEIKKNRILRSSIFIFGMVIFFGCSTYVAYAEEVSGENAELVFESEQDVENDLKAGTVLNAEDIEANMDEDTLPDVAYDEELSEETAKQALNNVSYIDTNFMEDAIEGVDIAAAIDDENGDVEDTKLSDNINADTGDTPVIIDTTKGIGDMPVVTPMSADIEVIPEADVINVGTEDTPEVDDISKDTENGEDIESDAENKDLNQETPNQEVSNQEELSQEESNQEAEDQEVANQEEAHVNGWIKSGGQWYYYKDNTLVTGWLLDKDKWYYLNPKTGVMQTEWLKYKDNWYYLRPESGAMVSSGWAYWKDKWYWLKPSGIMAEGEWLKYKDSWYYLRPESGAMVANGWANWNDKWYWLKQSGIMAEGEWLKYKDSWYYLRPASGAMVSNGWTYWNNKWYWLKQSGVMATSEWAKYKNEWYYLNASGVMAKNEWAKWNNKWYWLKPSGIMARNEWLKYKNSWYWLQGSGEMAIGIAKCENDKYYYLADSGIWEKNYTGPSTKVNEGGYFHVDNGMWDSTFTGLYSDEKNNYYVEEGKIIKIEPDEKGRLYLYSNTGKKLTRFGIDVSEFQSDIDWNAVKEDGVDFAFIRVGGRFYRSGNIFQDDHAIKNLTGANEAGIDVGVYFFTQAINVEEALEEAQFTVNILRDYKIDMPVVIDTEPTASDSRHRTITKEERTEIVKTFCEYVESNGYKAMYYAGISWSENSLDVSQLDNKYEHWVPQYWVTCQYTGPYRCWQFSDTGRVNGISGDVDMNIWYDIK